MLEEIKNNHKQNYKEIINSIATELTTLYKQLDCECLHKKTNEETEKYTELVKLLNNRLADIENRMDAVNSLLTDQERVMRSLKHNDTDVDTVLINTLLSSNIDKLLKDVQVPILVLPVRMYAWLSDHFTAY